MPKQTTHLPTKSQRQQERRERQRLERERQLRARRNRNIIIATVIVVAILVIGGISYTLFKPGQNPSQASTSSNTTTADASTNPLYPSVNGIACNSMEQLTYHVHAHLSIYINGQQAQVPQSIGIPSDNSCFYWLHTHDTSGIIHIEAPKAKTYALGDFFQIWHGRFPELQFPAQLGQTDGWTVYVNGKQYNGDINSVPLTAHALVTLAYNSPGIKPDTTYNWQDL